MVIGSWLAWFGATLWYGASGLRLIVAEPEDVRLNRMGMIRAFHHAITAMRASLRLLGWTGAGTILVGMGLDIVATGSTSLSALIAIVAAGIGFVGLTFHVEPLATSNASRPLAAPHRALLNRYQRLTAFYISLSLMALVVASRTAAHSVLGNNWGGLWAICGVGGALLGAGLTSTALVRPVLAQDSPAMEVILAVIGSRWSGYIGLLNLVALGTLLAWSHYEQLLWQRAPTILVVLIGATLLGVLLLRLTGLRQLWRSVLALPISGMPDRSLRARVVRSRRWTLRVMRLAFFALLLSLLAAIPLVAVAANITTIGTGIVASKTPTARPTATPRPTPLPTATFSGPLNLSGHNDGVHVSLTDSHFTTGAMTLHLTVTNDQGQAIPNLQVTLALSPTKSTTSGTLVNATADPDGDPSHFDAAITFSQADAWEVVVVVATADQSILASLSFSITVS